MIPNSPAAFGGTPRPAVQKTIALTAVGAATWVVPLDWTPDKNTIHCIGGGGGGGNSQYPNGTSAGGGAAYAAIFNVVLTPGLPIHIFVGGSTPAAAGGDTWVRSDGGNGAPGNTTQGVMAKGGFPGAMNDTNPQPGGRASECVGTARFSGGWGGGCNPSYFNASGGAGGAGGPFGDGASGAFAAGQYTGGAGGAGDAGHGGAGGPGARAQGGAGTEWTLTAGGSVGSGGGSGGSSNGNNGPPGGLYGAGGPGGSNGSPGTTGATGLIVIQWGP